MTEPRIFSFSVTRSKEDPPQLTARRVGDRIVELADVAARQGLDLDWSTLTLEHEEIEIGTFGGSATKLYLMHFRAEGWEKP